MLYTMESSTWSGFILVRFFTKYSPKLGFSLKIYMYEMFMPLNCTVCNWNIFYLLIIGEQATVYIHWSAWKVKYSDILLCLVAQVRTTSQTAEQERSLNDHSMQLLRDELASVKQSLSDCQRRENSVSFSFVSLCHTASHPVDIKSATLFRVSSFNSFFIHCCLKCIKWTHGGEVMFKHPCFSSKTWGQLYLII